MFLVFIYVFFHIQDPQFLDINSDFLQVCLLLGDIRMSIDELQDLASTYTSYQKKFKVFQYPRSLFLLFISVNFYKTHKVKLLNVNRHSYLCIAAISHDLLSFFSQQKLEQASCIRNEH